MHLASNILITSVKLEALFDLSIFVIYCPVISFPGDGNCKEDAAKCYRAFVNYWFLCLIKILNFKVGETPLIYRFGYGLAI